MAAAQTAVAPTTAAAAPTPAAAPASTDGGGTASTGGGSTATGGGGGGSTATGGGSSSSGGGTASTGGGGTATTGGGSAATGGGSTSGGGGSAATGGSGDTGGGTPAFGDGGYGVPENGYPTYRERLVSVLTNAVRADPVAWKAKFLTGYTNLSKVLQPSIYPAVPALGWNYNLNRSSRYHSGEMAGGCPFQHESCDGGDPFTRIESFYGTSNAEGENIAAGYGTALATVVGWICDAPSESSPMACATDSTTAEADGHRTNIMDSDFRELGCGYVDNPSSMYGDYWTQDFGGNAPHIQPAAGGSHMPYSGKTYFLLNYSSASAAMAATLNLAGVETPLTLEFGSTTNGTYTVSVISANACRSYHFTAMDSQSRVWRFPETGELQTFGEGSCANDYVP